MWCSLLLYESYATVTRLFCSIYSQGHCRLLIIITCIIARYGYNRSSVNAFCSVTTISKWFLTLWQWADWSLVSKFVRFLLIASCEIIVPHTKKKNFRNDFWMQLLSRALIWKSWQIKFCPLLCGMNQLLRAKCVKQAFGPLVRQIAAPSGATATEWWGFSPKVNGSPALTVSQI